MNSHPSSQPSFVRRSTAWFILAATGNLVILMVSTFASLSPLRLPVMDMMRFLYSFASPVYRPELLFFTSLPGLLLGLGRRSTGGDGRDRLVVRAIQIGTTIALSFAIVVVIVKPVDLAIVLTAAFLSFATFVLAERIAPPRALSDHARVAKTRTYRMLGLERAAVALGPGWRKCRSKRVWPALVSFMAFPLFALIGSSTLFSLLRWGPAWTFDTRTVSMFALTAYGACSLVFAWLAMADKADSYASRAWRGGFFIASSVYASGVFASVFFLAGKHAEFLGWLILAVTALEAALLWSPIPWFGRRALHRASSTITHRHLMRLERSCDAAEATWSREQRTSRPNDRFWRNLSRRTAAAR